MPSTADQLAAHALDEVSLFRELAPERRAALVARSTRVQVAAGDWLFRQGDVGDGLYVVLTGRLEVVLERPDRIAVRVLARGSAVGELGLLTGSPRSASVFALRDSELLRVGAGDFAALLYDEPDFTRALMHTLAEQLQESRSIHIDTPPVPSTIAVVGLSPGVPAAALADRLAETLGRWRKVTQLDQASNGGESLAARLDSCEREADQVVLAAPELRPDDEWGSFCLRQADRVLALAGAGRPPAWLGDVPALQRCDIVYCDDVTSTPQWHEPLAARTAHRLYTRPALEPSADRIARRLAGRSVGLVLSGGGARAMSHIGVMDELIAAGVPVDRVAGCSSGAFLGVQIAQGADPDEMRETSWYELVEHYPWNDWTIPMVAPIRGFKLRDMFDRLCGDRTVEELDRQFFTVSSDLVKAELVVHDRGPLKTAVAASMCLPGGPPPVAVDGRLLIDGAIIDNLPVSTMAKFGEGPIIAVDVTARFIPPVRIERGHRPRSRRLRGKVRTWVVGDDIPRPRYRHTMIRAMLLGSQDTTEAAKRHAALVITPETSHLGLTAFKTLDEARELGRVAAREALDASPEFVAQVKADL